MGKKGGGQVIGYKYFLGEHQILCHGPIDYISQIRVADKIAWEGRNTGGRIVIDKPELFGGKKREGGIEGDVDIEMGGPTQTANDYLVAQLGSDVPGNRGVVGAVLRQVYLGNNPYLKDWGWRGSRIYVRQHGIAQWYPAKAGIPKPGSVAADFYPVVQPGTTGADATFQFGPNNDWMIAWHPNGNLDWWYIPTRTLAVTVAGVAFTGSVVSVALDSEGTVWFHGATGDGNFLFRSSNGDDVTWEETDSPTAFFGKTRALDTPSGIEVYGAYASDIGYIKGIVHQAHAKSGRDFCINFDGEVVGVFQPNGASSSFSLINLTTSTETVLTADVARGDISEARICHVEQAGHYFVWMDDKYYLIDDETLTITDSGDLVGAPELPAYDPDRTFFWHTWTQYSLLTGAVLRTIDPALWLSPVSEAKYAHAYWDNSIWTKQSGTNNLIIRELDRGPAEDMNPAHVIRECLTDPDWGMGYQDADIDDDSFMDAADTLYTEGLGISLLWDRQILLEAFISEVIKHIDAALYVSRTTGKFVLKLIRDEGSTVGLLHLDESNIDKITNPARRSFGELCNSITVNFWSLETGKDDSITVQDTAMVQMQGAVIGTTVQYPGFTNGRNATIVGQRDLRSLSSQLFSSTVYANREAEDLNIGDRFLLSWGRWRISQMVMRVTGVAFGTGRNNQVRITCAQDVFSTPDVTVIAEPGTEWVDPSGDPTVAADHIAFEAPYYELVQQLGQVTVDDNLTATPETGVVMAAAGRPTTAISADVWTDSGAGYADNGTLEFCPTAVLDDPLGKLDTDAVLTDGSDLEDVEAGTFVQLGTEICRVDAINPATGALTLGRGCLDTVPVEHAAGTTLFFWDEFNGVDATEYVDGEVVNVKILPISGQGQVPLALAPKDIVTLDQRAFRPYPPGDLRIEGESYGAGPYGPGVLTTTWKHRDRTQQTGEDIYDHTFGDIGPETDTTYRLRGYVDDVLATTVEPADPAGEDWTPSFSGTVKIEVHSKRDGLYSLQAPFHEFEYEAPTGQYVVAGVNTTHSVASDVMEYDAVYQGDAALFDNASDTVVAIYSGKARARASLRYFAGATGLQQMQKNGSTTYNAKGTNNPIVNSNGQQPFFTGIQDVSANDDFSLLAGGTGTTANDGRNWIALEYYPSDHRYCQTRRNTDTASIPVDTITNIGFNEDLHDPEAMHDPASNTERHQVPTGGPHLCRYRTQLRVASSGGSGEVWLMTRYSSTAGGALNAVNGGFFHQTQGANQDHYISGTTAILSVPSGAEFATAILSGSGATAIVKGTQNTWAELEVLPSDYNYTHLRLAANSASIGAGSRIPFDTMVANPAGATIPGDGSITTPAGFTKAKVSFNLIGPSSGAAFDAWAELAGAHEPGLPWGNSNGTSQDSVNGEGAWFDIDPAGGQAIDINASTGGSAIWPTGAEVWFCVEFSDES